MFVGKDRRSLYELITTHLSISNFISSNQVMSILYQIISKHSDLNCT